MQNLILVAIGGAVGSSFRYLFIEFVTFLQKGHALWLSFPLGTVLVNVIGSFLMGLLHFFCTNYFDSISPQTRLLLATGVLGGFTTFSAFSLDALRLISASQYGLAFIYILSSVIISILAIFLGFYFGKIFI